MFRESLDVQIAGVSPVHNVTYVTGTDPEIKVAGACFCIGSH
jgi:hypothetical protein